MAILSEILCSRCKEGRLVSHNNWDCPPDVCGDCQLALANSKMDMWLNSRKDLSIDDRLSSLELDMYHLLNPNPKNTFERF